MEAIVTPETAVFSIVRRDSCLVIAVHAKCAGERRLRAFVGRLLFPSNASVILSSETVNHVSPPILTHSYLLHTIS